MDKEQLKKGAKKVLKGYGKEMKEAFQDGVEGWKKGTWNPKTPQEAITKNKATTSLFGFFWPKQKKRPKTGLKGVLEQGKRAGKRWLAIGATLGALSGIGHGITAVRHAEERSDLKENAEHFIQNNNQALAFSEDSATWHTDSQVDIFKLNKNQLTQYNNFMSECNKCLGMLVNDMENNLDGKIAGTLDPSQRFGQMYDNLLKQIENTEKDIVSSRGASEDIVKHQILQKVFTEMQKIEKKVSQGKTQAERLQIAENLKESVHARANRSGTLGYHPNDEGIKKQLQKEQVDDFSKTSLSSSVVRSLGR